MQNDLIIINDYCERCDIEPDFVLMLGEGGLIDVEIIGNTGYFPASQLGELERYTHLYYDLSIRHRRHPPPAPADRRPARARAQTGK